MATMIERKAESERKEIAKLEARLERETAKLEKKISAAEKIGANCTREEWYAGKREEYTQEQRNAWFEVFCAQGDVEDTTSRLNSARKRLDKLTGKVAEQQEASEKEAAEVARIGSIERRILTQAEIEANAAQKEAEYQKWLAEFKAECLKDGITIDNACGSWMDGTTAKGKRFFLDGNNGWTNRSRHCYSLTIDGNTVFTSGEFLTAYRYLKKK